MHSNSGSAVSEWNRLDWYKRKCSGWRRDTARRNLAHRILQGMV